MRGRLPLRRIALVFSAALAAALLAVNPASAAGDARGPGCADIVDGDAVWSATTLTVRVFLAKPPCSNVTYTVYATLDPPGGTVYSSSSYTIDPATGALLFTLPVADPDLTSLSCNIVDFWATTSVNHHVADRAPNAGSAQIYDVPGDCGSPSRSFH